MNQAIFPHLADSVLSARDVGVRYASRRGPIDALAGVDLRIGRGEFVSILGPSGCGKSTLLKLAAGLLPASQGELLLDGTPISAPRRETGVVFQKPNLLPWKSVRANVLLRPRPSACRRPRPPRGPSRCWSWLGWRRSPTTTRSSCPAACSSGSASPACCCTTRSCC